MSTHLTEKWPHRLGFVLTEQEGVDHPSRDVVTLLSGQVLSAGTLLGKVRTTSASAAAKAGGNTGNGVMGAVTTSEGVQDGIYRLRITKAATNAGDFEVAGPNGDLVGVGTVGAAFSGGGLAFTLADGSTDFAVGDGFDITASTSAMKYRQLDPAATDGHEHAAAILGDDADATAGDMAVLVVLRGASVVGSELIYPAGITTQQKAAAVAELAALNPPILVR